MTLHDRYVPTAEVPEPEGEGLGLQLKLLSLLENPAVIVAAAASGDVATLRDFLRKHPTQVFTWHGVGLYQHIVVIREIYSDTLLIKWENGNTLELNGIYVEDRFKTARLFQNSSDHFKTGQKV